MRTLMAYFSWSNNTKKLIEKINEKKKYDVIRIERAIPYSDDYDICAYKEAKEEVTKNIHPAIKPIDIDLNHYDRILLFFPNLVVHIPNAHRLLYRKTQRLSRNSVYLCQ